LYYPQITLEAFVVMPNHIHGIVLIDTEDNGLGRGGPRSSGEAMPSKSMHRGEITVSINKTRPYKSNGLIKHEKMGQYGLLEIMRAFKSFSARRINQMRNMHGVAVWQRTYYDHIIRNEKDLHNTWEYIQTNPQIWQEDQFRLSTMDYLSDL
jgi:putative transposase